MLLEAFFLKTEQIVCVQGHTKEYQNITPSVYLMTTNNKLKIETEVDACIMVTKWYLNYVLKKTWRHISTTTTTTNKE